MTPVTVRELRKHTAALVERARRGETLTVTVDGVPAATLGPVQTGGKTFLSRNELMALAPHSGESLEGFWHHEFDGDTTEDLRPLY